MSQAVIGIIFNNDQTKVLILKRRDVPVWVFPGGGVDTHEDPKEAIVREVLEETGLHIKIVRKIGKYTPINRLSMDTETYECVPVKGTITTGEETKDIRFCPVNELPKSFFSVHKDWLDDALKNHQEVISKPLSQVTYWSLFKYFLKHPIHVVRFAFSRAGMPLNDKH